MKRSVLFRADANSKVGMGHLMRCSAMAEFLKRRKVHSLWIRDQESRGLSRPNGFSGDRSLRTVADWGAEGQRIAEVASGAKAVVWDMSMQEWGKTKKGTPRDAFRAIQKTGARLIAVDPFPDTTFPYDAVILPFYGAKKSNYAFSSATKLLIGHRYFIFRKEFVDAAGRRKSARKPEWDFLVSMGGSDPGALTLKVLEAFAQMNDPRLTARVVLGPGFARELNARCEAAAKKIEGVQILRSPRSLAALLVKSRIAVVAGGATKYEAALLGVPCVSVSQTPLEARLTQEFAAEGSAEHLGLGARVSPAAISNALTALKSDPRRMARMSACGMRLLDAKGVDRIFAELRL